ncbi:MAG: C40 family peptidase [candidate division Zixibacteria bacterium]|nr:C40 family peptidase [candidate division Zixibacteria bacterium]
MTTRRRKIRNTGKILSLTIIIFSLLIVFCVPYPRYNTEYPSNPAPAGKIDKTKMTRIMESYLGQPYSSYDCSRLVYEVYRQYSGIRLPSETKKLYRLIKVVEKNELDFGDLVFFSEDGIIPSHVGIYIGDNKFVHSSSSRGVIISSLKERYYDRGYLGARRVIQ